MNAICTVFIFFFLLPWHVHESWTIGFSFPFPLSYHSPVMFGLINRLRFCVFLILGGSKALIAIEIM